MSSFSSSTRHLVTASASARKKIAELVRFRRATTWNAPSFPAAKPTALPVVPGINGGRGGRKVSEHEKFPSKDFIFGHVTPTTQIMTTEIQSTGSEASQTLSGGAVGTSLPNLRAQCSSLSNFVGGASSPSSLATLSEEFGGDGEEGHSGCDGPMNHTKQVFDRESRGKNMFCRLILHHKGCSGHSYEIRIDKEDDHYGNDQASQEGSADEQAPLNTEVGNDCRPETKECSSLSPSSTVVSSSPPSSSVVSNSGKDYTVPLGDNIQLLIDNRILLYCVGLHLDYVETLCESRFVFNNIHAKTRCGCGNSFGF